MCQILTLPTGHVPECEQVGEQTVENLLVLSRMNPEVPLKETTKDGV